MQDFKHLIDRIKELYDGDRISGIRNRIKRFWSEHIHEDRIPYVFRRREVPKGYSNSSMDLLPQEEMLKIQLEDIIEKANINDDYIPSLISNNTPYTLASEFGCKSGYKENVFHCYPILADITQIRHLGIPDIEHPSQHFKKVLETVKFFIENTEGNFPIHTPDPHGPVSLATVLMDQENFFCAMLTNPKGIHKLLEICTEAVLRFHKKFVSVVGKKNAVSLHCMPYVWREPGEGASFSEDMIGVLSPEQCEEFVVPYLEKLSKKLGSLVIHSCGDCTRTIGTLFNQDFIAGLHLSQTDISQISNNWPPDKILLTRNDWGAVSELAEYVREVKDKNIKSFFQIHSISELFTMEGHIDNSIFSQVDELMRL